MDKGNKKESNKERKEEKAKLGRPSKYTPENTKLVYKLSLLGATDAEMADIFNVSIATINNWKIDHPSFLESIKRGKIEADANVAKSLYKRANGYKKKTTKLFVIDGQVVEHEVMEHHLPDVAAANIWLKNRRGKVNPEKGQKWAERQEIDHTTKGDKLPGPAIDLSKLSDETLEQIEKELLADNDADN